MHASAATGPARGTRAPVALVSGHPLCLNASGLLPTQSAPEYERFEAEAARGRVVFPANSEKRANTGQLSRAGRDAAGDEGEEKAASRRPRRHVAPRFAFCVI